MRKAVAVARGALALSMCATVMGAGAHSNSALAEALLLPGCDDLEARIAELEATAVRGTSGNLSFRLYGQVNRALFLWKDGFDAGDYGPDDSTYFYYLQIGISKPWLSLGKTTLYADHGLYKDFNVSEPLSIHPDTKLPVVWGTLTQAEVNRWGFGIELGFDAAAPIVYAQTHFYDPKIVGYPCEFLTPDECGGDPAKTTKLPAGAWQGFVLGARIQF